MLDTIPFTSVHSNLEHRLAILTESFSPLRSVLHNLSCWSPKQKWCDKPHYSWYSLLDMREKAVLTSSHLIKLATATKVDVIAKQQMPSGKFHCWWSKVEADAILSHYFNRSWGQKSHNNWNLIKSFCSVSCQKKAKNHAIFILDHCNGLHTPPLGKHLPRCFKI